MHARALVAASLMVSAMAAQAQAQERTSTGPALYKVEFNIRDGSDALAKNGRRYTLLVESNRKAIFKVGSRVPTATGSFQPGVGGVGVNPLVNTQYTYLDVGVNVECIVSEMNGRIALHGNLDLSSIMQHEAANKSNPPNPTIGQTRLDLDTSVEAGKPTVIAAIDDPATMRQLELTATVTRMH